MQLVVVMAVRKAVSAATTTFTAISIIRFFIIVHYQLSIINCEALVLVYLVIAVSAVASGVRATVMTSEIQEFLIPATLSGPVFLRTLETEMVPVRSLLRTPAP